MNETILEDRIADLEELLQEAAKVLQSIEDDGGLEAEKYKLLSKMRKALLRGDA